MFMFVEIGFDECFCQTFLIQFTPHQNVEYREQCSSSDPWAFMLNRVAAGVVTRSSVVLQTTWLFGQPGLLPEIWGRIGSSAWTVSPVETTKCKTHGVTSVLVRVTSHCEDRSAAVDSIRVCAREPEVIMHAECHT